MEFVEQGEKEKIKRAWERRVIAEFLGRVEYRRSVRVEGYRVECVRGVDDAMTTSV